MVGSVCQTSAFIHGESGTASQSRLKFTAPAGISDSGPPRPGLRRGWCQATSPGAWIRQRRRQEVLFHDQRPASAFTNTDRRAQTKGMQGSA